MRRLQSSGLLLACISALLAFAPRTARAVPISLTYTDGPNEGFNDPVLGPARRNALQAALVNWGGKLGGNVPIAVSASMDPLGGTANSATLAQAYANYAAVINNPPAGYWASTWYPASLICVLAGQDLQPGVPMIVTKFNSDVDNPTVLGSIGFYYGTDGNAGSNINFYSVALHEIGHGLGFYSNIQSNGAYYGDPPNNLPTVYDQFLAEGQSLSADRLVVRTQAQRAAALIGGSLFFNGGHTRAANGGPNARLYAPSPYLLGSSTSHLDQATFQNGDNSLMCPAYSNPVSEAGSVGYAVLRDISWPFTTSQRPVANNSSASVSYDTPTTIQMSAVDPENEPLTYTVISGPSHGSLSTGSSGQRTYTPAAGYAGPDSFTFRVNDGHWDSNVATVSITVLPPVPVISSFTPTSGPIGASVTINGQRFGTFATVSFNGVMTAPQWPTSDTQIVCTVPVGATTGPITVTGPGGSTNSTTNFTVVSAPTGSTDYANDITSTSATLRATVNPGNQNTIVRFQWGPTTEYTAATPPQNIGNGTEPVEVSFVLDGLEPGTTYHYSAIASNNTGSVVFEDSYFVTMRPDGGTALQFNGAGSSLKLPAFSASGAPTDEITVEFWQNVASVKAQFSFITTPDNPGNRISGAVPWDDGNVFWDFGDLFGTGRLVYTPPPDQPLTGQWEHWAFVNSAAGDFMKIYRNGIEVASKSGHGTYALPATPLDMTLGVAFDGSMDEFRIWNRARTAEEIYRDVYRRVAGSEPNLVRLFHFDEGAGVTAVDSGPFNAPASFQNDPLWVASLAPIGFPVSITLPATNIGPNSATLNGLANPNGRQTFVGFQWGNDATYGNFKFVGDVGSDFTDKPVSVELTGLEPGTTYHFRLEGDNGLGGTRGVDQTFTTVSLFTFADAGLALQCAAGLHTPTAAEILRWDVVQDEAVGQVTFVDAARLARKVAGLEPNP